MREYRRRKRVANADAPAAVPFVPSVGIHKSLRVCQGKQSRGQLRNLRLRRAGRCEKVLVAALEPR